MWKIIVTENPLEFNLILLETVLSFVYESYGITIRCMQRSCK